MTVRREVLPVGGAFRDAPPGLGDSLAAFEVFKATFVSMDLC